MRIGRLEPKHSPRVLVQQLPLDLTIRRQTTNGGDDPGAKTVRSAPVAAPPPSLNADEQRRFDAGREIYRNICQACHLADGRGQDRIAPTLIGAAFTLGPSEIPPRILLNGKEGAFSLMPPVGSMLTDEQIASVLTYVRREWGQAASAVDTDTVKRVRAISIGRRRPWTDEELIKLAGRDKP